MRNVSRTPAFLVLLLLVAAVGSSQTKDRPGEARPHIELPAQPPSAPGIPQVSLQAGQQGPETLRVFAGKSMIINSPEPLKRVSVTDPAIASAIIISPNQVLIDAHVPGSISLLLWDEQERTRSFDLQVDVDLSALQETLRQA